MYFSKKFVSAQEEYGTLDKFVSAPYFIKTFRQDSGCKKAEITICGLGFYELYINGINITKGKLAPYIANPDDILYYDNYDITEWVCAGDNVIGILLGNGMQNSQAGDIWDFDKAAWRSAPKLALCVELDGKITIEADESFLTHPSPIIFDDLRAGEHYDARLKIKGWNTAGFDSGDWKNAILVSAPKGECRIPDCEPIKEQYRLSPVSIVKSGEGYIYDFGKNIAGCTCLKIIGKVEQKVSITHGELLIDGKLSLENISYGERTREGFWQRDVYICSGEGEESYLPYFTYHGFQYAYVTGIESKQATKDLLTAAVFNSDVVSNGKFSCSCNILNRLQENTGHSDLSNFYYFPTDCPHREKNGWTGDISLSAEQLMLNFSAERSLKEWLNCLIKAQKQDGSLPGIVPTGGWGFEWGNGPAWDAALINVPYYVYKYTLDIDIITRVLPAIKKYLAYSRTRLNGCGLLAYGLGDWCPPDRIAHGYDTPLEVTDTLTIIDVCYKALKMAKIAKDTELESTAKEFYSILKDNFRLKYIKDGRFKSCLKTQTGVAMALYHKMFTAAEEPLAAAQLVSLIKEKDDHFDTGILGARVLFRVLSKFGYVDLAYKLITQKTFPSYRYHLDRGSTTLFEDFWDLGEDKAANKSRKTKNSMNHHFWGDISAWFYRFVAGLNINSSLENAKKLTVSPIFIDGIESATAAIKYCGQDISVAWQRKDKNVTLSVSCSKDIEIEFALEDGYNYKKIVN